MTDAGEKQIPKFTSRVMLTKEAVLAGLEAREHMYNAMLYRIEQMRLHLLEHMNIRIYRHSKVRRTPSGVASILCKDTGTLVRLHEAPPGKLNRTTFDFAGALVKERARCKAELQKVLFQKINITAMLALATEVCGLYMTAAQRRADLERIYLADIDDLTECKQNG